MPKMESGAAQAKRAIAACRQSGADTLDLSGMQLSELPPAIATLTSLKWLSLRANRLTELPPQIAALCDLRTLDFSDNRLQSFPPNMEGLGALRELNLANNDLTTLPPGIGALTGLNLLDLNNNRLTELPPEIGELTNLTTLALTQNALTELPPEIGALTSLTEMTLASNRLTALPREFAALASLERLYLFNNELRVVPPEILGLTRLMDLTINSNHLTSFPPGIGNLTALEELYAGSNRLKTLPPEIGSLGSLRIFYLDHNELEELPREFANLTALQTLSLRDNSLSAFPPEFADLTHLRTLDLSENELTILPPETAALGLASLSLNGNRLTALPPEMAAFKALRDLDLAGNPLPTSYFDALAQGPDSFRTLLESLGERTEPLFEGKLLVTGEGQVGKSWALASLQGRNPREAIGSDNTTWGIDRGELRLPHPSLEGREILLNTWDFGGQQIYRVTHQFFFSEQAIYILVWNPRQGAAQCRVREWLRMIALRTGSHASTSVAPGETPKPRAKVIMVATHAKSEGGSYNADYGRSSLDRDLLDMIVGEVEIDSDMNYGIAELRAMIAVHAATLPDMGQPFNTRWAAAREAVLQQREIMPWINFDKFAQLCAGHDVTDREQLRTLAWTYLHSLGRAIWYGSVSTEDAERDDPLLADTIVLDAVWLSRAFVQVLDDEVTQKAGGMLDHRRFPAIWTDHDRAGWHRYRPNEYEILKLVMRRFDVALPTRESEGKRSLVPQLVPYRRPEALPWSSAAAAPGPHTIRLTCELGYEATGLVARLIAATEPWHVYADGVGLFWEGGILLEETASFDNQALVTVHGTERPSLHVVVSGDQPAFLMNELYKTLEGVLSFWKGMTRKYFVGCPTFEDHRYCDGKFKLDTILRRISDQIAQPFVCDDCDVSWTAEQLILWFKALKLDDSYILHHMYRRDQLPCPRMFLLEPADKSALQITSWAGFVGKRFKLTLVSEYSGQKVASKEFSFTRQWVKWVAPVTRVASIMLAGAALPIAGELAAEFKEGAALLDRLGALAGEGPVPDEIEGEARNIRLAPEQLAKFAKFLEAIELEPRSHGMDIAKATDGRWLWMNADEVKAFTPQEAAKA